VHIAHHIKSLNLLAYVQLTRSRQSRGQVSSLLGIQKIERGARCKKLPSIMSVMATMEGSGTYHSRIRLLHLILAVRLSTLRVEGGGGGGGGGRSPIWCLASVVSAQTSCLQLRERGHGRVHPCDS
jgi:hypothetical protein